MRKGKCARPKHRDFREGAAAPTYLYKQPESEDEKNLCEEALAGCPVEAIGRDGE